MPEQLITADVQQSFIEYRTNFKEPITSVWFSTPQGGILAHLQKALAPWQIAPENISFNIAPKNLAEIQLLFSLPSLGAAIQVTLNSVLMSAVNVDWSRAPQYIALFQTAADALKGIIKIELQPAQTTLAFHLKPGPKPFKDILRQFVNATALDSDDALMYGVSAYCNDHSWVLDGSAVVPNGLFIKSVRLFPAAAKFEEIAGKIRKDEETILRRLGFKIE